MRGGIRHCDIENCENDIVREKERETCVKKDPCRKGMKVPKLHSRNTGGGKGVLDVEIMGVLCSCVCVCVCVRERECVCVCCASAYLDNIQI